jgi:arsenate reductase
LKIYHNPRCRKSRETLALLEEKGQSPEVILYLKTPPNAAELRDILQKLGMTASQLIRKNEAVYKENYKGKNLSEDEWLTVLAENPKLIERPIVVVGDKAAIGRPPEQVLSLL